MKAKADDVRVPVLNGARLRVEAAVRRDRSCPALAFMKDLSVGDKAKLLALFQRLADHGRIEDGQKYKRLDGDVWEFKARGQDTGLRVTCYRNGNVIVLLTGFRKKEDEADPREVALATAVLDEDRLNTNIKKNR